MESQTLHKRDQNGNYQSNNLTFGMDDITIQRTMEGLGCDLSNRGRYHQDEDLDSDRENRRRIERTNTTTTTTEVVEKPTTKKDKLQSENQGKIVTVMMLIRVVATVKIAEKKLTEGARRNDIRSQRIFCGINHRFTRVMTREPLD